MAHSHTAQRSLAGLFAVAAFIAFSCSVSEDGRAVTSAPAAPFAVVLGIAQDGGYPHAGCERPCCARAWNDPGARRSVVSLGLVDPAAGQRWMIDATPDFRAQLHAIEQVAPPGGPALDGVLLTHAHIGHYTGLTFLGREAIGARDVPVWAMPRMADFLAANGPWDQLVRLRNIDVRRIAEGQSFQLNEHLTTTPITVPHRDEYSETVGYRIEGPTRSLLFIPDVDKWERMDRPIEALIAAVDVAFLDGTFYADGELPGRSMAEVPHPFITESLARFAALPAVERAKIRFIHLNHTNPALDPGSPARAAIRDAGMHVAEQGERVAL